MQRNLLLIFTLSLFIASCDPHDKPIFNTEHVKLKATINNISETVLLGDTLKISLRLPDTIVSNTRTIVVQSLQRAFYAMRIFKVDTVNKKGISQLPPLYWASQGSTSNNLTLNLNTDRKPYGLVVNFKPKEKGIYYFEVVPQPGDLAMNKDYLARLYVGFDVADKHYNLLSLIAPYFSGQPFYDAVVQSDAEGFGVYFFRVD